MKANVAVLIAKISSEKDELMGVIRRVEEGFAKAKRNADDFYLDSVALNIHSVYSGIERIFERIASHIDNSVPANANWHQELLKQMAIEIPELRPAVITTKTMDALEEYRGFRHVVRNVYTHRFNAQKIEMLVKNLPKAMEEVVSDLNAFVEFLKNENNE